ncbi:hypothetical protein GALL_518870 [mine drainage metagenome]|uniref:Uncharacterized protein n=1 Tax=mine drainage metagenome TaxID=410659 RepID=A0A1J5PSJ7_9ZZZZ
MQVGAPDIAAVDHPGRQHPVRRQCVAPGGELLRRADQVEVDAIDRQAGQRRRREADRFEVSRQQQFRTQGAGLRRKRGIQDVQRVAPGSVEFQGEGGFVELHPVHAEFGETRQHPGVACRQRGRQGQTVEARQV